MVCAGLRKFAWSLGALLCACSLLPAQPQEPAPRATQRDPARSFSPARQLHTSSAICRSARFPAFPRNSSPCSPSAAASFRRPTRRIARKTSSTPAWSAPAPPIGRFFVRSGEQSRCWSSFPAPRPISSCSPPRLKPSASSRTTPPAFSVSTGASIPPRPSRFARPRPASSYHPARLDHDALADSVVEGRTIYHFYSKNAWTILEMPD